MVSGCAVPNPTWVAPRPAPSDCVTRSRKYTTLFLKPGVLRFARLLPTTSTAVAVALSADNAVENEVNIGLLLGDWVGAVLRKLIQIRAHRRQILAHVERLLELLELRELREKLNAIGRVERILI